MPGKITKRPTILFVFVVSLLVQLPVALTQHLFEPPDENAHYATVSFLYDQKRLPTLTDQNTHSLEEAKVEALMGTLEGQNRYSYHPEYRLEQIPGVNGKYEALIGTFNTPANRTHYEGKRAAVYPPLYYVLALPFYHVVSAGSLIERLFSLRLLSVLLSSLTITLVYLIGRLVLKSHFSALTLAALALLFPMTTYLGGGINSDNLHILLTTAFVYLCLVGLIQGWNDRLALACGLILGLDFLTKPQAYILLPILLLALLTTLPNTKLRQLCRSLVLVILAAAPLGLPSELPKLLRANNPYLAEASDRLAAPTHFLTYLKLYLKTHLTEMPVWYWGVFKWFGVLLPKPVWWLALRTTALAGLGILLSFCQALITRSFFSLQSRLLLFLLFSNVIYVVAILFFDWQFYQQFGRSLGLQARYYLPLLSTQLLLILMGFTKLLSYFRLTRFGTLFLFAFFLIMHLTGFWVQLAAYYDVTSVPSFVDTLSQYKPALAKGNWWYLWFSLYLAGIISLVTAVSRAALRQKNPPVL